MATSKRHWRKWLAGVGTVGILAAGLALFIARYDSRQLLQTATPIADLTGWDVERTVNDMPIVDFINQTDHSGGGGGSYYWLNNDEILNLRGMRVQSQQVNPSYFAFTTTGQAKFVLYNVNTRREAPLSDLSRLLQSNMTLDKRLYPSPDGSRLLWTGKSGKIEGATFDGKSHFRSAESLADAPCWLDNSHWASTVRSDQLPKNIAVNVADVAQPQKVDHVELASNSPLAEMGQNMVLATQDRQFVYDAQGYINSSHSLVSVRLYECDLRNGMRTLRKHVAHMPAGCSINDFRLAPQGDRIAWLLHGERLSPLLAWLHRIIPAFHPKPRRTIELWVSDLDGGQMKEIGWVEVSQKRDLKREPWGIKWLPNGKALSFQYLDKLYRAPAE